MRLWLVAPLLAALLIFVPVPPQVVDRWYSQGAYPYIQDALTAVSNLVPFAVLDALIAGAVVLVLFRLMYGVLRALTGHPLAALSELLRRTVRGVSLVLILFLLCWGMNYRRLPLESALGERPVDPITVATLEQAVVEANRLAGRIRPASALNRDVPYPELAQRLFGPMNDALRALHRAPLSRAGVPKSSLLLTPYFSWAGINGMIDPLVLESIVQPDLVPAERAFVLAHEWAHLAGQADEADASAVGWLACMHGDPTLAYSASVYLVMEAGSALPPADWKRVSAKLDGGVRADLVRIAQRMQQQKPRVQQAATRVYDGYLRANRVPDGTASYGRALTLILRAPLRDALTTYTAPRATR
ncbi:MAG: DUF3810 family protein [Vicinamibacterales bacterium]